MIDDHVFEDSSNNNEIGLWGFILICYMQAGGGGKRSIEQEYLFINVDESMAWLLG